MSLRIPTEGRVYPIPLDDRWWYIGRKCSVNRCGRPVTHLLKTSNPRPNRLCSCCAEKAMAFGMGGKSWSKIIRPTRADRKLAHV